MTTALILYFHFNLGNLNSPEVETGHSLFCFIKMVFEFKGGGKKYLPGSLESTASDSVLERFDISINSRDVSILNNVRVEIVLEMGYFPQFSPQFSFVMNSPFLGNGIKIKQNPENVVSVFF